MSVPIMSDFAFIFLTIYMVRAIGMITIVLDICACYVIIAHSTSAMAQYKWVLLGMSLVSSSSNMIFSLLILPARLGGAIGVRFAGLLSDLFPDAGEIFMMIVLLNVLSILWSVEIGFAFRLYTLDSTMSRTRTGKFITSVMFSFPLPFMVLLSILFYNVQATDEQKADLIAENHLHNQTNSAFFLIIPENYTKFVLFSICTGGYIFSILLVILVIIFKIRRIFSNVQHSERTIIIHKSLLKSLIFQSIIPSFFLCLPTALVVLAPTNQEVFDVSKQSPIYPYVFIAISPPLFACYSPAHAITTIAVTKPYREFIMKCFSRTCGEKIAGNVLRRQPLITVSCSVIRTNN